MEPNVELEANSARARQNHENSVLYPSRRVREHAKFNLNGSRGEFAHARIIHLEVETLIRVRDFGSSVVAKPPDGRAPPSTEA